MPGNMDLPPAQPNHTTLNACWALFTERTPGAHLVYLKHLRALDLEVQRGTCPNPSLRRVTYVV